MLKINKGSAVIEITLLVPLIFGSIYFYIMSMLFLVEHGRLVDELSEKLYEPIREESGLVEKQGSSELIKYGEQFNDYEIYLELSKDGIDPVKNLRRWQLLADTIR